MAFTEGYNSGVSTGTTPVSIVASPASSTRRIVKTITVHNADSSASTVTISIDDNTNVRTIIKVTLAAGDTLIMDEPIVLDDTVSDVQLVLSGAVSANELPFTTHYGDAT